MLKTFVAIALLASALARAQTPAAPALPASPANTTSSPAKKELVAKVLELQRPAFENMGTQLAAAPALQLRQQAAAALQQRVPQDKREAVGKELEGDLRKYVDDAAPLVRERALRLAPSVVGPLLEERFNEDELKQVIGILESQAFRKYIGLEGDIQRALGEKLVADTRASIEPKVRALEQSMMKRLGVAPTPASAPTPAPKKP
jgi:uncharacterized protein